MTHLLALLRVVVILLVVLITAFCVLAAAFIPFKIRRVPAPLWVVIFATRTFNLVFNVKVRSRDVAFLRRHKGFLFLNHLSFIEPLVLLSLMPVRYLSAIEMRRRPVVGWMAEQIGTIFVERGDRESRRAARRTIADVLDRGAYPPLVVFPEGRLGLGDRVYPFRYGIFQTAAEHGIPYLLCALRFNRPDIAIWQGRLGEGLVPAVWRLATFPGPLTVHIDPLVTIEPTPAHDAEQLARSAQRMVAGVLSLPAEM